MKDFQNTLGKIKKNSKNGFFEMAGPGELESPTSKSVASRSNPIELWAHNMII